MLFYVVECFTVNLENLAADPVGGMELGGVNQEVQGQGGFVAKTLGKTAHEVHKVSGLDADGAKVRDEGAELGGLVFYGLLEGGEVARDLFRTARDAAAKAFGRRSNLLPITSLSATSRCVQFSFSPCLSNA